MFECRQHALRPDAWVRPLSYRRGLSGGSSRERHCHRFVFLFPSSGHYASIFLHPFAPPALPGFLATMGALTPERSALRTRVSMRVACPGGVTAHEHRPLPFRSPCFMYRTFPPFRLQPPVAVSGSWSGFSSEPTARSADRIPRETRASVGLHLPLEVGHGNRPNRVRHPADQRFTFSCSPPPLMRTQLLSVSTFRPNLAGTCTPLIRYIHKRTTAGPSARMTSRWSRSRIYSHRING